MDATVGLPVVVALIRVALIFDYINGFHDAANSIATVVSTRVLSPGKAVVWAAFFNFVAAFTFGTAVAKTVGSGHGRHRTSSRFAVIFAGLMRRDRLGPDHVVLRAADQLVARAVRRLRRRGRRQGRASARSSRPAGRRRSSSSSWRRSSAWSVGLAADDRDLLGLPLDAAGRVDRWFRRLQLVSAAGLQPDARRQRRAEDDGHHRRRAVSGGYYIDDVLHPVLGRAGRARGDRRSARCRAAGASSTRWDRRSRSCSRSAGSPRRPARRDRDLHRHPPRRAASARRTRSPARSSASARRAGCRRCAGASRGQIVWAWLLTIPGGAPRSPRSTYQRRAALVRLPS